jgi:DNA-binding MarR family transcriptional regulator
MPEPDVATLTHRLAALTRRKVGERMARETWAHEAGFRPGCMGVLQVVAAREPVSQREVSEALLLDPSDVVTLVDILERAGLVERRRDPADRRRYALEVTPRGQLAVVRLREINRETDEDLLAPLDEAERAQLAELIARVVRHHTGGLPDHPDHRDQWHHAGGPAHPGNPDLAHPAHPAHPADAAAHVRAGAAEAETATAIRAAADEAVYGAARRAAGPPDPDEGRPREVPVMPGHPERAPEPYDPDREAERARVTDPTRR